uniref:Polygalacturonase n=1 Tax=Leersia perrieri TaxID=77586 RepID=A0A0D9XQV9_9ORYZ
MPRRAVLAVAAMASVLAAAAMATTYNVVDYGAAADGGETDSAAAFVAAWAAACADGGSPASTVLVPATATTPFMVSAARFSGPCRSGALTVDMTGAAVVASGAGGVQLWIVFENVDGLVITGGTLDGRGGAVWSCRRRRPRRRDCPPATRSLTVYRSRNVAVRGLTSIDSAGVHVTVQASAGVEIAGAVVSAPGDSPNTDGIHIKQSRNVTVRDAVIGTGDDCVSMVEGSQDVWIEDVTCGPGHGISIGSLGDTPEEAAVKNITVKNATLTGTTNGLRIKTWAKSNTGLVNNIIFSGIVTRNVSNPIIIDQNYCPGNISCPTEVLQDRWIILISSPSIPDGSRIEISSVSYTDVEGTSATSVAVRFDCSPSRPCVGIVMHDVWLRYQPPEPEKEKRPAKSFCRNAHEPPDIRNWFSSYEYESPEVPELDAGHGGNSNSETQDPLAVKILLFFLCQIICSVGIAGHSLLEHTTRDGDDDALRENHCGRQYNHEVSDIRDLIPTSRNTVDRGAKRKQSLRSLFGAGFLDNLSETSETESSLDLSVQRINADPLLDCNAVGLPDDDTQEGQECAIEHGKLPVDWNGVDVVADTQECSQGDQDTEHSRLTIGDGMCSSHTGKGIPKDGNEQCKLSIDCNTRASKVHIEKRFQEGIQNSVPPIDCNGIIIPDTEENSPGEETCHSNPIIDDKGQEATVAADGFVAIKRKAKPEQAFKTSKILKPPMRSEKATLQENHGIVEQVIVQGRVSRSPLADMTNLSEVAAAPLTENRGKWKCPRKGKPYIGPPLKQLRLEQWVRRGD